MTAGRRAGVGSAGEQVAAERQADASAPSRSAERGHGLGVALALLGAFSYGVTIVINRTLAERGFGSEATLSIRFGVGAAILFALLVALRRPLLPPPAERWRPLLLGAIGYAVESALFYRGLERGSAAAVALLFYSYPAMVTVAELFLGRTRPSGRLIGALVLSLAGAALIVLAGEDVAISTTGVVFALTAAASFSIYLIVSSRVVRETEPLVSGAWVSLGAALSLATQGLIAGTLRDPGGSLGLMLLNGLATASAFSMLLAALRLIGASRTAVVMTFEAMSAVALGWLLLDEPLTAIQLLGGAAIVAAIVLLSNRPTVPTEGP